jgi:hypothetical protein
MAKSPLAQRGQSFQSTDEVAEYIVHKYQKEDEKVNAIYNWVISNFRYDEDSTFAINAGLDPTAKITVAFKKRKGVCDNISAIFNDICLKSGIVSFVVSGYTKQGNFVDKSGHSWTAASINKQWYLFDPTWDLGRNANLNYYMTSPQDCILTHMPFDPLWQLLNYPITHTQFNGRGNGAIKEGFFNYSDSIISFMEMDSLQKLQAAAARIHRHGIFNERIKVNYEVIKMNIEIAHQEKEVELYNSAMDNLNVVTNTLNQFIQYRNNQFIPLKSDLDLKEMLNGIDEGLKTALNKLDQIDRSEAKLVLATESERQRISLLDQKIKVQKIFLNKYLGTETSERKSLFYEKKKQTDSSK